MRRTALALALAALAAPLVALPASADEPAALPAVEQGRLIPRGVAPGRAATFSAASSQYLLTSALPGESAWPPAWSWPGESVDLRRLDGSLVRRDIGADGSDPALVGEVLVNRGRASDGIPTGTVQWRDPATAALLSELQVPADDEIAAVVEWGLVTRHRTSNTTFTMVLRHRDGRVVTVPGLNFSYGSLRWSADGEALLVTSLIDTYVVDVPTATATPVALQDSSTRLVGATASRYWWSTGTSFSDRTLHWLDRRGVGRGSVPIEGNDDLVPYGDRVAVRQYDAQDGSSDYRPVDLETGELEPEPVGLVQYTLLPEGTMVGLFDDDEHGHVATFQDEPSTVDRTWELPAQPLGVGELVVTSSAVHGRYDGESSFVSRWDGVGGWRTFAEPGYLVGGYGDVVLTVHTSPQIPFQPQTITRTATWPGGSRVLDGGLDLMGRGGILYLRQNEARQTEVREVRTGRLVRTDPAPFPYAIDGTWLWRLTGSTLTGTDTASGATRTTTTGTTCTSAGGVDVAGRWAVQTCAGGAVNTPPTRYVVDTFGVVPTRPLPVPPGCDEECLERDVALGPGFVARAVGGQDRRVPPSVVVTDLSGVAPDRAYGENGQFSIADAGPARLAYNSPQGPRVVDLDWLGTAPTTRPDTTAPALGALTGAPASGQDASMTVGWSATDPDSSVEPASGVASYDARFQQSPSAGAAFGAWTSPAGWTATTATSVTLEVPVGSTTCVQVRARDAAGNVSAWSASRCYQRLAPGFTAIVGPGDLTGDGRADLLARAADGRLWLYPGTGTGAVGAGRQIGSGWGGFTAIVGPGDLTGDGKADVVGRAVDGTLWLYPGTGTGPVGKGRQIGSGWGGFTAVVGPGDLTGDGRVDLLGRAADGRLWLYPGSGTGPVGKGRQIGSGWGGFTAVVGPGDLTGDRRPDLLGRAADGSLWLYPGTGTGAVGAGRRIGTGWGGFTAVVGPGDLTGDRRPDLLGRAADGSLWLYPGTGTGAVGAGRRIGTGW